MRDVALSSILEAFKQVKNKCIRFLRHDKHLSRQNSELKTMSEIKILRIFGHKLFLRRKKLSTGQKQFVPHHLSDGAKVDDFE